MSPAGRPFDYWIPVFTEMDRDAGQTVQLKQQTVSNNNKSQRLTPVAGNGLLDRRLFLQGGLVMGAAQLLAGKAHAAAGEPVARPEWMNVPGKPFTPYGQPAEYEDEVVRYPAPNRVLRNNGASWSPLHRLEGMITPNGLHYERHHNGVPQINPDEHRLLVHGLVRQPAFFSIDNLLRYPMRSQICFVECGGNSNAGWNDTPSRAEAGYFHGLVSCSEWTGVPLPTVLAEVGHRQNGQMADCRRRRCVCDEYQHPD